MPSLRIYFDVAVKDEVDIIRQLILQDNNYLASFDNNSNILQAGFYEKILEHVNENYYISDYFEIGVKNIPTLKAELSYFKYGDTPNLSETTQYPILIKKILNPRKKVLCFYTRAKISNKLSNDLLAKLKEKYHFVFRYQPILFQYKRDQLNALVNALGIKDFTAISCWDRDNKVIIKNPKKITETKKYLEIAKEQSRGNWTHLKVPFDELGIELRINNNTQNFITFENKYIDDTHLVKAVDFLINKIIEVEEFSGKKQTYINSFY